MHHFFTVLFFIILSLMNIQHMKRGVKRCIEPTTMFPLSVSNDCKYAGQEKIFCPQNYMMA